jgi:hypothetical protein
MGVDFLPVLDPQILADFVKLILLDPVLTWSLIEFRGVLLLYFLWIHGSEALLRLVNILYGVGVPFFAHLNELN